MRMGWLLALLASPWFRTFIAGAGFFADAYDLFITDGVTNILKNLGPVTPVPYTYTDGTGTHTITSYFNVLCFTRDTMCLPQLYNNITGQWERNPSSYYNEEMVPRYQTQSSALKNGVNNAALIGSVLGQVFFGLVGDLMGRKWSFVVTSALIILGALGSATAAAGVKVPGNLNSLGHWGDVNALPHDSSQDVYLQLNFWRGILGFGVGGEYPLASTITSEGATASQRGLAVLSIFSMQGWGKLTAALTNYGLISTIHHYGGSWELDATWRFALAFGCTLNILTLYFRWHLHESKIYSELKKAETGVDGDTLLVVEHGAQGTGKVQAWGETHVKGAHSTQVAAASAPVPFSRGDTPAAEEAGTANILSSAHHGTTGIAPAPALPVIAALDVWTTLRVIWEFKWTLVGTASTWFLIDVTFYGQSLMNTTLVASAIADTSGQNPVDKLRTSLLGTVWIMLIALPGYFLAMAFVERMGRWRMQQMGFFTTAVCFAVLAAAYHTPLRTGAKGAGFVFVYGLTYLFSNFGANSSTFLMPAEAFPTRARSTGHGFSAAMGKLGATAGSFGLFDYYNSFCNGSKDASGLPNCGLPNSTRDEIDRGVVAVMAVCAAVSIGGNIMTTLFCKETGGRTLEEVDASSAVLRQHDARAGRRGGGGLAPGGAGSGSAAAGTYSSTASASSDVSPRPPSPAAGSPLGAPGQDWDSPVVSLPVPMRGTQAAKREGSSSTTSASGLLASQGASGPTRGKAGTVYSTF